MEKMQTNPLSSNHDLEENVENVAQDLERCGFRVIFRWTFLKINILEVEG